MTESCELLSYRFNKANLIEFDFGENNQCDSFENISNKALLGN